MNDLVYFAVISLASLFVIVDPIGSVPIFMAMTVRNTVQQKVRMARTAALCSFVILAFFLFTGDWIFRILRISLSAFAIAGGIILMIVALDMLQARETHVRQTHEETDEGTAKEDVAITPLAIPMLAGPGSITTVLLLAQKAVTTAHYLVLTASIFVVCVLIYVTLRYASLKAAHLSVIALRIISRLMGLLLAAIAVQFVLDGVQSATLLW